MSIKSILLSIFSVILFLCVIVGFVFLFKTQFILGLLGLLLLAIPIKMNRKAVDEANGTIDKVIAKFLSPVLALIGIVFVVLFFTLWM